LNERLIGNSRSAKEFLVWIALLLVTLLRLWFRTVVVEPDMVEGLCRGKAGTPVGFVFRPEIEYFLIVGDSSSAHGNDFRKSNIFCLDILWRCGRPLGKYCRSSGDNDDLGVHFGVPLCSWH